MLAAAFLAAAGWAWGRSASRISTDNAYLRADVTSLAPKVGGYVTSVEVSDNQVVHTGDVLYRIDDRDFRAKLAQAQANVRAAQARLVNIDAESKLQKAVIRQAEAQHRSAIADQDLAIRSNDRRRELFRSNSISQAQLDESDASRSKAEAAVSGSTATLDAQQQRLAVLATQRLAAEAALSQVEAASDIAQIDLDSTIVKAPVTGIIGNRQDRTGRYVVPGASLIDLVPNDEIWVVANFKETQVEHIQRGQRVRIRVDGYPDLSFDGMVDSFAPGSGSAFSLLPSDNSTGNFVRVVQRVPVKIRFSENPALNRLVPGLSARVDIDGGGGP